MLIGFIGAPGSGKTTTAALVFAHLKDNGYFCEFIPEQARIYIADTKIALGLKPYEFPVLTDLDQISIMKMQLKSEDRMKKACGDLSIIVSDSSTFNALLYMEPRNWTTPEILACLNLNENSFPHYDLLFHSPPIFQKTICENSDPNRVHTVSQSVAISDKVRDVMGFLGFDPITLKGDSEARAQQVLRAVTEKRSILA